MAMTLLSDRLISDSGLELARVFDDARYDLGDLLDSESVRSVAARHAAALRSDAELQ
jgi:hypothetical protein